MVEAPSFNAIFACLAAPHYYRKRIVSDREIFVGPDCETAQADGRFVAVKTPGGEYDMAALIAQLPADQRPDVVVVKADASMRNLPRNMRLVKCPRVLLVGDTHHMNRPVGNVIRYAMQEPFDVIVMDHTRHHGHFFLEAGFPDVYWIPAFDYVLRERPIPAQTDPTAIFVGQTGRFHPYRRHVLAAVSQAGLPLRTGRADPEVAADLYAASRVTLNCSLNGDLNLRIFEVLGSGGLLLTDRLTRQSGLDLLFAEGRHLDAFSGVGELTEKIRHYLDHPAEADALRRAGRQELLDKHHPDVKRAQLFDIVFNRRVDPALDMRADGRCRSVATASAAAFQANVALYELLQEIHRTARTLHLFADLADDAATVAGIVDLPRVSVQPRREALDFQRWPVRMADPAPDAFEDEYVLCVADDPPETSDLDRRLACFVGRYLIVSAGSNRRRHCLEPQLEGWGFFRVDAQAELYVCRDPAANLLRTAEIGPADATQRKLSAIMAAPRDAKERYAAARALLALGDAGAARAQLVRAVQYDRDHGPSLSLLARVLADAGALTDALIVLREKSRTLGLDVEEGKLHNALTARVGQSPEAAAHVAVVSPSLQPVVATGPKRILVVTNLFPPQEMGGYGRKLWEFAAELHRRGYAVKVLTADADYLTRPGDAGDIDLEPIVERSLRLFGRWENGRVSLSETPEGMGALSAGNADRVREAIQSWGADACLFGNVDLMGMDSLYMALRLNVPVVHCIGSGNPGYPVEITPRTPLYRPGPASAWVMSSMRGLGYPLDEHTVVYPGARVDYFYRHFQALPDKLRIAFASLVLPYKGPQVLAQALALLHERGVDFECAIAGDTTEQRVVSELRAFCDRSGFGGKVRFTGFVDRPGLRRLFADHNVLVFPSIVDEAFGISQVEAMASGLVVVTSATGGAAEIVRHRQDGLVFKRGDAVDLAENLAALQSDRALWSALSLGGRARALEFAISRSVDAIVGAFAELDARRRQG